MLGILKLNLKKVDMYMTENDTVRLLKECNSGAEMAVYSINEVLEKVKDPQLFTLLNNCKSFHSEKESETESLLNDFSAVGKTPNAMAKTMSWMKTNATLAFDNSDSSVAKVVTDGCNMGAKALAGFINEYSNADESSKKIAEELIKNETQVVEKLRDYL